MGGAVGSGEKAEADASGCVGLRAFPLLADAGVYRPSDWDLVTDAAKREYWVGLFGRQFPHLLDEARAEALDRGEDAGEVGQRLRESLVLFEGYLGRIEHDPGSVAERIDTLEICRERERILRGRGFADPYRLAKAREDAAALAVLPQLLRELDGMDDSSRAERLMRGVFAGNIYDLGAPETIKLFGGQSTKFDFGVTLKGLKGRPWLVDDLDVWLARWKSSYSPYRCAVLFVDNAGSDIVLGMIPLTRELLRRGTGVILTANTHPSLNDITHDELVAIVEGVAGWDPVIGDALGSGALELVGSGNGIPLIDLSRVSVGLCEAVQRRGVDLVVLEGMGRALESNFFARFACDSLKIAMVKDAGVAGWVGGEVYDLVLKFEGAGS